MATPQQYIQSMAQQASPFVPNNGNPNTVYNTAATPFGGQAAAWQDISPFGGTNIDQHWSFAPAPTAAPMGAYADPSAQFWNNATELAPAQFNLDQSGAVWPDGSNPFMPTPQKPAPGTGITVPDGVEVDVHPHDPNFRPTPVTGGGSGMGAAGGNPVSINVGSALGGSSGTISSRPVGEISAGLSNLADSISRGMGFKGRDGKFDPMQFLDAITEAIIPGDLYNANVGKANWPNAVKAVLNTVIPGLGKVAEWLISKLPDGNPIKEWLEQGKLQDLVDEAYEPESYMNAPQTSGGGGGRFGAGLDNVGGSSLHGLGVPVHNLNRDLLPIKYGRIRSVSAA